MSANIPDHMLLSDLLKSTGYNCPADLQGKSFNEAIKRKLYAFDAITGAPAQIVYTSFPPEEDTAEIDVYVPRQNTGITKMTGSYNKADNKLSISTSTFVRKATSDITL